MDLDGEEENGHFVSDEYLIKLIDLVKTYTALYDPQKPDFNNKTMKGFYWKEVQRQLEEQGFSASEAKKAYQRYNSLKKKLLKEQARLDAMGIPESQRIDRARFRFYTQMMVFYPYIEQQKAQVAANFIRPSQYNASRPIDLSLLAMIAANSEPERINITDFLDSPKEMLLNNQEK
uniref:MADF domain-containing protein n=1 Tax=Acrobeloides nanus TaxID=290746 RepID=A0A914CM73_9BILA